MRCLYKEILMPRLFASILGVLFLLTVACSESPPPPTPVPTVPTVEPTVAAVAPTLPPGRTATSTPPATPTPVPTATPSPTFQPPPTIPTLRAPPTPLGGVVVSQPPPTLRTIPTLISPPARSSQPSPLAAIDQVAARKYAVACGQLSDEGDDLEFVEWVDAISALVPPPALQDFHESWVALFEGQIEVSNGVRTVVGPNDKTQEANWRNMEIVSAMSPALQQILIDGRCLLETEIIAYNYALIARARLEAQPVRRPQTAEAYVRVCADINAAAPRMNTINAVLTYYATEWQALIPPAGLEDYHAAVLDLYWQWNAVDGDIDRVPVSYLIAVEREAYAATLTYPSFVELLFESGCGGY